MSAPTAANMIDAIHRAFGVLPLPQPKTLIDHPHPRDPAGEEQLRRRLAGRPWQSLDQEFLERSWAAFCYLSPTAYRYYLPALLVRALECPHWNTGLPHSVVYGLQPSYWALYYRGADRQLEERQAAFTDAQYTAVCDFLGLMFSSGELRHLAAQALRWGWNRLPTAALQACREYYQRLHHYAYPEPADPEVAARVAEIRSAFAATPYPGDDQLCGSEQGDEPAEYALELRGLRWQEIHPDLLAQCYAALSFLSDAGFRYFLPAFLVSDLLGFESNADPVFHLTHGLGGRTEWFPGVTQADLETSLGKERLASLQSLLSQAPVFDWKALAINRFREFTRAERLAIIHYLEYRLPGAFEATSIHTALESYWRPSAEAAP